jgi:hypothetical protein
MSRTARSAQHTKQRYGSCSKYALVIAAAPVRLEDVVMNEYNPRLACGETAVGTDRERL